MRRAQGAGARTPVVTERDSKFQVSYTVDGMTSAFRCPPAAADLFCAAPDLLAACEAALLRGDIADCELGAQLRAAIERATKGA